MSEAGTSDLEVMPLEQYAAVTALIDAGRPRDEVLVGAGLSREAWTAAQTHWLTTMADQARLKRFELQRRFNDLLLERLGSIEAGEDSLGPSAAGTATVDDAAKPAPSPTGTDAAASPIAEPPPVAPPPVVGSPDAVAGPPPPAAVDRLELGRSPGALVSASPWSDGGQGTAPPAPPATSRPKRTTLAPFAAVAAPLVSRPARSLGDGVLPFAAPPMPTAAGTAAMGPSAAEPPAPPPVRMEPVPVLPFDDGGMKPPKTTAVAATLPVAEGAPVVAPLPFSGSAPKPAAAPAGPDGALPFAVSSTPEPPPDSTAEPVPPSVPAALPFGAEPTPKPPSPPPAAERPKINLTTTMHVDASAAPRIVLPFAAGGDKPGAQPSAQAGAATRDGALPFRSQPSAGQPPGAEDREDAESMAGTAAFGRDMQLPAGKPRLSLEQFASLSAEIAVHPDQKATIEARYGLDPDSHDREKGAWAVVFLGDEDLSKTYTDKVAAFRGWLQRKG